jgi:uncharacterized protein YndB with AHSA1/START domain
VEYAPREGYLALADISGYTAFLTGTELDHAHAIVRELTTLIRRELEPPLQFVKLEGDAVFCYADGATFHDGERFLEVIEACYVAFSNRLDDMARATTCRCRACASIGSLGLKFLAHYGTFVVDDDEGRPDLAGGDVILVHRLLKNSIGERGMSSGYAFFTDACMQRLPLQLDLPVHSEVYDGFGTITGAVHDLRRVLAVSREAESQRLTAEDADFEIAAEFPTAAVFVWQYCVDPVELQRWACIDFSAEPDVVTRNEAGRVGPGATSHCTHGPGGTWFREFLEWRPLQSFTCRTVAPGDGPPEKRAMVESFELAAVPGGTRVTIRVRVVDRAPEMVDGFRQLTPMLAATWQQRIETLGRLIDEDNLDRSTNAP